MSRELKSCPFCGQLPRDEVSLPDTSHIDFSIHCINCGVEKTVRLKIVAYEHFLDVEKAMKQVIQEWNQRVVTECPITEIEESYISRGTLEELKTQCAVPTLEI